MKILIVELEKMEGNRREILVKKIMSTPNGVAHDLLKTRKYYTYGYGDNLKSKLPHIPTGATTDTIFIWIEKRKRALPLACLPRQKTRYFF